MEWIPTAMYCFDVAFGNAKGMTVLTEVLIV
jgi:hypothetical protein